MRPLLIAPTLLALMIGSSWAGPIQRSRPIALSDRAWLDAYCTFCHGKEKLPQPTAGLVLDADAVDVDNPQGNPRFWERVLRRIRGGSHPHNAVYLATYRATGPEGTRTSSAANLNAFISSMSRKLDGAEGTYWELPDARRLGDPEVAARLATFLWGSDPDLELQRLAGRGDLSQPGMLERQARRLLRDRRSAALVGSHFEPWLGVSALDDVAKFPTLDDELRRAMHSETTLFLEHQLRADRPVLELVSANYSFLNARLAQHYGVPRVSGSRFQRVTLTDPVRRGLLGHASILTVTSMPTRTSPVRRSVWVTSRLLGAYPASKPFNAPLRDADPSTAGRALFEEHRRNPACASCHAAIDPIGMPLETFDAIGRSRVNDAGAPIDAAGSLVDVTLNGPADLRDALLQRKLAVVTTAAEGLLSFAVGRSLNYQDMPAVRRIVREAAPDYRWSSLIVGVARSIPFAMERRGNN